MFNAWIHLIAGSNVVEIVDLHSLMENEFSSRGESRSRDLFVKDNFHLSKVGALVVARFVGDTIATGSFAEPKEFRTKP